MANTILADLSLRLSANTIELQKGLALAKTSLNGFKSQTTAMASSLSGIFKEMGSQVEGSLNSMTMGFGGLLKAGVAAFRGLAAGAEGFAAALISTGIGAILVAIGVALVALVAAFKRSGTAADEMEKAIGYLKGTLEYFVGVLVKVGEWIVKVFEAPKAAIKDLGDLVVTYLVRRFKGLVDFFAGGWETIKNGALGVAYAIAGIFDKDAKKKSQEYFAAMADGLKKMGQGLLQFTTGMDYDKFLQGVKAAGEEGLNLAKMENDLWAKRTKILEDNTRAEERLSQIKVQMSETDRTSEEGRLKYSNLIDKAIKEQMLINKNNVDLAKSEYALLNAQLQQKSKGNLLDEDAYALKEKEMGVFKTIIEGNAKIAALKKRDTLIDAKAADEREKAAEDYTKMSLEDEKRLRDLKQQDIILNAKNEEQAAILKAGFDRDELLRQIELGAELRKNAAIKAGGEPGVVESNLAKIEQDKADAILGTWTVFYDTVGIITADAEAERTAAAFAELTKQLDNDKLTYDQKLTLLDNYYTGVKAYDKNYAAFKADLDEQEKQRMLQQSNDYLNAATKLVSTISSIQQAAMNNDLAAAGDNEVEKEKIIKEYAQKQKDLAVIQAIINTALGVTAALSTVPPYSYVLAALTAVAGAAEIATIASQPLAKGGIAYGKTLATVGEYPGARSNPEVIAPLDKLRSLLASPFGKNTEVKFVIEQDQLVGILSNYNFKNIYF